MRPSGDIHFLVTVENRNSHTVKNLLLVGDRKIEFYLYFTSNPLEIHPKKVIFRRGFTHTLLCMCTHTHLNTLTNQEHSV